MSISIIPAMNAKDAKPPVVNVEPAVVNVAGGVNEIDLLIDFAAKYYNTVKENIKVEAKFDFSGDMSTINISFIKDIYPFLQEYVENIYASFILSDNKNIRMEKNNVVKNIFVKGTLDHSGIDSYYVFYYEFSKINPDL